MKFSDGYWLMRPGVHASYPAGVLDTATGPDSLEVYAPVQRIRHRGDLLSGPVVTLTFTSPMPDVIGVEMTHFAGGRAGEPNFHFPPEGIPPVAGGGDGQEAACTS